jgi:hypothetical protein
VAGANTERCNVGFLLLLTTGRKYVITAVFACQVSSASGVAVHKRQELAGSLKADRTGISTDLTIYLRRLLKLVSPQFPVAPHPQPAPAADLIPAELPIA